MPGPRGAHGPKVARSTVLPADEEAAIVALRRYALLPLDDRLYAPQPSIPPLTRSSLHRCLRRHGISRRPDREGDGPKRSEFEGYPIGFFHIDIAEVRTEGGKLFLFAAIDRTSELASARSEAAAGRVSACAPSCGPRSRRCRTRHPRRADRQRHPVLPPAALPPHGPTARWMGHPFARIRAEHGIGHRPTKPDRPWTNGRVERMNRTIREATVERYHYGSHDQLRHHLQLPIAASNHARRLKTLRGLTRPAGSSASSGRTARSASTLARSTTPQGPNT